MDWTFTLKWIFSTIGVLGLVYLAFYLSNKNIKRKGRDLEILEGLPLGSKQGIYLVRARDRILVIGITASGMQVLTEFANDSLKKDEAIAVTKEGNSSE